MIRRATQLDVAEMVVLGHEFHQLAQPGGEYDPVSVAAYLREVIKQPAAAVFVIERDGKVVGAAGVMSAPTFYNFQNLAVFELFWFVREDARGRESLRLFAALEEWAVSKGAKSITMTAVATNAGVGEFYVRRGYHQQETHYMKELK